MKISYNNVFGYYLEVRNTHKDKVPPEWIRKQTLVSAERYITQELKEYEEKILGAEEKILNLDSSLFMGIIEQIRKCHLCMQKMLPDCKIDGPCRIAGVEDCNNYKTLVTLVIKSLSRTEESGN